MDTIESLIGEPAHRIAAEIGADVAAITLGSSSGPSAADGASDRWPLFVDGSPHGWLWDTANGFELADSETHA
jgi:hypothetical protein